MPRKGRQKPAAPTQRDDPLIDWARAHTPLLATILFFSLVVIRVLSTAQFDPATATALVRESGPVSIALGVLVTSFPQLLSGSAFMLLVLSGGGPGTHALQRVAFATVLVIMIVLTVLLPWIQLLITFAVFVGVFFFQRKYQWRLELFAVVALVINLLLTVSDVWLPPEVLVMNDDRPRVVYVLQTSTDWTTILLDSDRTIKFVNTTEIVSRQICNLQHRSSVPTIYQLILGEKGGLRNPSCSERLED